ncbi:MAG: peroxide stress protein YaaA [Corynebacterium sp.]|nr:peroxide stress protein YaaA [Corynebacterium sp.]
MLILLPPSETKAVGGDGAPLDFSALSFPELNPVRSEIAHDLSCLPTDEALSVLGISQKQQELAEYNTQLLSSPTMPALSRFTGVLYDALDAATLQPAAWERLAIGDALFGLLMADDLIPFYRLSGSNKLPRPDGTTPTLKSRWGKAITTALDAVDGLVVDLRSGTYQQLGKLARAVTIRVEKRQPDGSLKVVSHFNKHYKGVAARVLAEHTGAVSSTTDVADVLRHAGMEIQMDGDSLELKLIV